MLSIYLIESFKKRLVAHKGEGMSIRCSSCKKDIIEDTKWDDWLYLMHFVQIMFSEERITQVTCDDLIDKLMTFKYYAEGEDEEVIEEMDEETDKVKKPYNC